MAHFKIRRPFAASLLFLITCVPTCPSVAWEYELIQGKQYSLCREYQEVLNTNPEPWHSICQTRVPKEFSDFWEPEWEMLDPMQHLDVLREIYMEAPERQARKEWYRSPAFEAMFREAYPDTPTVDEFIAKHGVPAYNVDWFWEEVKGPILDRIWEERVKPKLLKSIEKGRFRLGRSRFNIDHWRGADTVYRHGGMGCRLLDEDRQTWERIKREQPERAASVNEDQWWGRQYYPRDPDDPKIGFIRRLAGHGFFYKGRFYFATWGLASYKRSRLTVYETSRPRQGRGAVATVPVCRLRLRE